MLDPRLRIAATAPIPRHNPTIDELYYHSLCAFTKRILIHSKDAESLHSCAKRANFVVVLFELIAELELKMNLACLRGCSPITVLYRNCRRPRSLGASNAARCTRPTARTY
jgi:hypothetical protein